MFGEPKVGKTQILFRFANDVFDINYISTIGVDFKVKISEMDGSRVRLEIWDLAGQPRFQTIISSYFRGIDGAMLVFDMTDRSTFDALDSQY